MVFRGKPSAACLPCRQRRLKCDQDPQGCASCRRRGVICSGYRNTTSSRFCDESKTTTEKYARSTVRQREPPSTKKAAALNGASSPASKIQQPNNGRTQALQRRRKGPTTPGAQKRTVSPFFRGLLPSMDEFAIAFCQMHYEFPSGIALDAQPGSSLLSDSMIALGLSTYANLMVSSDSYLNEARGYYLSALRKANNAIANRSLATKDQTLISIMMLTNLETILTFQDSHQAWSTHVNGTAALVELRGQNQLARPDSRLLFLQATTNIVSNCIRTKTKVPECIRTLTDSVTPSTSSGTYDWLLHRARLFFTDLYSEVASGNHINLDEALLESQNLDDCLLKALESVAPNSPCPDSLFSGNTIPEFYESPLFHRFLSMQCRLSITTYRLLLNLLMSALQSQNSSTTESNARYVEREQVLDDILFEIPEYVEIIKEDHKISHIPALYRLITPPAGVSNLAFVAAEQMIVEWLSETVPVDMNMLNRPGYCLSRGYGVVWPLALVGQIAQPGSARRVTACEMLHDVGKSLNLPQASVIADAIQRAGLIVEDEL